VRQFLKGTCSRLLMLTAGCWLSSATLAQSAWITDLTPLQVITGIDAKGQYVQLLVAQSISTGWGCENSDSYVTRTLPDDAVALALAALGLGKSLRIYVTSCDPLLGRPTFTLVGIM